MSLRFPLRHALRAASRRSALAGTVAGAAVLFSAGMALSGSIPAPPRVACCTGPLAVGDTMASPASGGDKDFFETETSPPGAVFLLGNNRSMQDFHTPLPEDSEDVTGCGDTALRGAMAWFDLGSGNPALNGANAVDPDRDFDGNGLHFFDPAKFYISYGTRLPLQRVGAGDNEGDSLVTYTVKRDFRGTVGSAAPEDACKRYWPNDSAKVSACGQCLRTVGWYRGEKDNNDRRRWVLSGRVLNVRPPKFVAARKVLKDVIASASGLRMGVATFSNSDDLFDPAKLLQPMRPQCNKSWPVFSEEDLKRDDLMRSINTVEFVNGERSIGESLYSLGAYFSSQRVDGRWAQWFTNPVGASAGYPGEPLGTRGDTGDTWARKEYDFTHLGGNYEDPLPLEAGGEQKSVCYGCQANAVIVLTDGRPDNDNTVPVSRMLQLVVQGGAKHPDGTAVTFTPGTANPGGINYCDQFGGTKQDCDYNDGPSGGDALNKNFMDDVAFFLSHTDLRGDMEGEQAVRTYTIGYGDNSPMLRSMALAGRGKFYRADDSTQLRDALMSAIGDLREVSTSFSSTNLASVQAGAQSSAFVPRFIPRRQRPFEGHLYRFFFFNEFAQGCDPQKVSTPDGDPLDLNDDGDCDDSFYLDRPEGFTVQPGNVPDVTAFAKRNIVQENTAGEWVKVSTASRTSDGRLEGGTPAVPFWDLGETLGKRSASAPCEQLGNPDAPVRTGSGRCIFTLKDRDGNGRYDAEDNPPIPFDVAHEDDLRPLLLAGGDGFCADVFAKSGRVWNGTPADQSECVRTLIGFVRGQDVFDFDGDQNTDEDRPCAEDSRQSCKLGDIFHSSPVVVEPPAEPFLCDLGLSPQCLRTLYADYVKDGQPPASEPVCATDGTSPKPCYQATPMDPPLKPQEADYGAYGRYIAAAGTRDRVLLVGANDGMLHAVHAGRVLPGRERGSALEDMHDLGTGQELWAFVPPDLLPKLGLLTRGHEYFVDGTPMVRDVWVDGAGGGSANGVKEPEEFRTLAVITERGGGQRYSALDVTDPYTMFDTGAGKGPFRWMFPQACDPEAATFGQGWTSFAPKPPPIGPVRLKNAGTRRGWDERWAVFINGGYSADLARGRSLSMVDAWTGQKLWSFGAGSGAGGMPRALADRMMPVAAAPALVDVGAALNIKADQDGFFDTVVVGDLGGQVWTFRLYEPGDLTSGTVSNWFGARGFELARDQAASRKTPFFNIASTALQPETGWLRAYLGSGDRQHLREEEGTTCGPDNLLACVRMKCDVRAELASQVGGVSRTTVLEYSGGALTRNEDVSSGTPLDVCGSGKLELTRVSIQCGPGALGSQRYTFPPDDDLPAGSRSDCVLNGGQWSCESRKLAVNAKGDLRLSDEDRAVVPRNTYVGFHAYGGERVFSTEGGAQTLDGQRWTDVDDPCPSGQGCGLRDVTLGPGALSTRLGEDGQLQTYVKAATLASLPRASTAGGGWFLRYNALDEKTAAGSTLLGGVVSWSSFQPPTGLAGVCRTVGSGDLGRQWQMDIITGWPDQADGFKLYDGTELLGYMPFKERPVVSPPSEPASSIVISRSTGAIRYTTLDTGVGEAPSMQKLKESKDLASDISWVEVPENVHLCRHVDSRACE